MAEIPTAAFLHISDLHLGRTIFDAGSPEKADELNATAIKNYLTKGGTRLQSHDAVVCATLSTEVRAAARLLHAPDDKFDLNIVTGDISTRADSTDRFQFARDFLIYRNSDDESKKDFNSLNFEKERVFCVPGNHDKWMELTAERYVSGFGDLPEAPPYFRKIKIARSDQRFVIIGIDSNLYEEDVKADGIVTPETLRFLEEQLAEIEKPEYADVVKILLLHHHPVDLNRFLRRLSPKRLVSFISERFMRMKHADTLLRLIRGKVHIIMHGHKHFPIAFYERSVDCFVISAGTTTLYHVKSGEENSFHAVAFYGKKIRVVEFARNKRQGVRGRFRPARKWEGDLQSRTELRESVISG